MTPRVALTPTRLRSVANRASARNGCDQSKVITAQTSAVRAATNVTFAVA